MKRELSDLKQSHTKPVVFTAGVSKDLVVPQGGVVTFDLLLTSVGGGYNVSTGVFTCPQAGYYMFHIHALGQKDKPVEVLLSHNDKNVVSLLAIFQLDFQTGSNSASLKLETGDTVKVVTDAQSYIYGYMFPFATFSGQLVALV